MRSWILVFIILAGAGLCASAQTGDHSNMDNSLLYSEDLSEWSFGLDALFINRKITDDNDNPNTVKATAYSASVGYDVQPWLTVYGRIGQGEARVDEMDKDADGDWNMGLGLHANLWQVDIFDPEYLAGTLSLKGLLEYSNFKSGGSNTEIKWDEVYVSLLLSYRILSVENLFLFPNSLILSLGPSYSYMKGSYKTELGADTDFTAENEWGYTASMDVYLSQNFSLGAQFIGQGTTPINGLEHSTTSFNLRYRY
ncbi:MAG: hypothetical protein EOM20_08505 [Spartobacteria bacterium]|nr:hypothetical protein [Spartobacteria bacterium]